MAIARAIAKRPDVLLCDEPTGALDITTGVVVLDALARVNRELGTTVAVITHNAAIAGDGRPRGDAGRRAHRRANGTTPSGRRQRDPVVTVACWRSTGSSLRDLWRTRSQVVAIALVIGAGVAIFVLMLSTFDSLGLTEARLLRALPLRRRLRLAEARAARRSSRTSPRFPAWPQVETRVVVDVTLDVAGLPEPVSGRLISIPGRAAARLLNDVFLRAGRWIEPDRDDEVLVSESFARANGLDAGDSVAAIINGRRRDLRIVGLGALARVRLRDPAGRADRRRRALRRVLDGAPGAGVGVPDGGRLQRRRADARRTAPRSRT